MAVQTTMKHQNHEQKQTNKRKMLDSLCSTSGLLLSVVCCIALIHVELRIHEHHRLISHSATFCDQIETEILRKVQRNYGRWQDMKGSHSKGHGQETRGGFCSQVFSSSDSRYLIAVRQFILNGTAIPAYFGAFFIFQHRYGQVLCMNLVLPNLTK